MTATTIRVQMAQRKDTAANWTAANPILLSGEIGYETDTKKFKIGNGSTAWNSLAYLPIPDGSGNLTITGNLEIGSTGSLTFEGSTADGFETTLAVTNPTADRTITLPDVTGTVVTTGDTGSVTSTMIANGTIVDADISSTAEIAVSKLANGTANQVIVTDGTNVSWSDNLTLAGDLTVNGTTTTINTQDLLVEDKNIIIGNVATPSDVTADGGGITLKGATDKTINWVDATDAWTLSEHVNIASGKEYRIAGTKVLDATSLGSSVLITSANITDGTIVDGDISATAEIAVSKLADGTARQLLQTDAAGTGVEWASDIDIPGTLDVTGAAVFDSTTSTTGTSTAASFIPTSSTAPTNGLYLSGTNTVGISTGGTGRLFVDASGNVGIGAAPSTYKLDAVGNGIRTRESSNSSSLVFGTYDAGGIAYIVADKIGTGSYLPLTLSTGGFERARIRADGMFEVKGAGTAGSSPAFSVSGSAPASNFVIDSTGKVTVQVNQTADTAIVIDNSGVSGASASASFIVSDGGATRGWFRRYRDGTGNNAIGFTDALLFEGNIAGTKATRMAINSSGNVGIGTTSPSWLLSVRKDSGGTTTGDYPAIQINNANAVGYSALLLNDGAALAGLETKRDTAHLGLYAGGGEKARIDSSGRLLVGTSTNTGGALLQVNGDRVRIATAKTPASATDTGSAGEICWDANYIYVCTATNTWKRTAIATW